MTARRAGNGGTHGSRPTGCGGHPGRAEASAPTAGRRGRRPLHTLSLRGAKRRGNPFSPARRDGFPRQCVPQGHLLRGAHWRGMTARRAGNGGTHGSRPTGCGGHPGRAGSSAPTTGRRGRRPLRNHKGCVQGADRGVRPYNGAARAAKFRNFFFPLSASAGLRRLYSDDTGRPPVL